MSKDPTVIYDGSIEGFLSALRFLTLKRFSPHKIVASHRHIPEIFEQTIEITNDNEKDIISFLLYLKDRISPDIIKKILYAYLSEIEDFETTTINYILRALKLGNRYIYNIADEYVATLNEICRKVNRECHRFYGLMRFTKTSEGFYYAPFEPDHNIISLIVPHFVDRLKDQTWIIHDTKRDIAVLYQHISREVSQVTISDDIKIENDEQALSELWQCYFRSLSIENRTNSRLQTRCMPKRYWKYLTEKTTTARQPLPYLRHRKPV
ncbi:MAG: TIGR03915 family putative DNA repair protein [Thermodesulfovibrionales bacterium]